MGDTDTGGASGDMSCAATSNDTCTNDDNYHNHHHSSSTPHDIGNYEATYNSHGVIENFDMEARRPNNLQRRQQQHQRSDNGLLIMLMIAIALAVAFIVFLLLIFLNSNYFKSGTENNSHIRNFNRPSLFDN